LAAFLGAWLLRFELAIIPVTKNVPEFTPYLRLVPIVLLLWPIVFYFHGLYQSRQGRSRVDEILTLFVAVLLATVLLSVVIAWYRPTAYPGSREYFTYSRAFLGLFALADFGFVTAIRMVLRFAARRSGSWASTSSASWSSAPAPLGREITQKILAHRGLGFDVVGFLDDDPGKAGTQVCGVPVLGTLKQAEEVLRRAEHRPGLHGAPH